MLNIAMNKSKCNHKPMWSNIHYAFICAKCEYIDRELKIYPSTSDIVNMMRLRETN